MQADDDFLGWLRDALNHLYNPDRLRVSPLLQVCRLSAVAQPAARLQQLLLDEIHALQPPASEPAASIRRRIYSILCLRYEQQFSQKEVAAQLGLSVRQYRRLQQTALESLAIQFAERCDLTTPEPAASSPPTQVEVPDALQWITKLPKDENARVDQVLEDVLKLIMPLAHRQAKTLHIERSIPAVCAIHPMVLRQALVNLLNVVILHATTREISLRVEETASQVKLTVRTRPPNHSPAESTVLTISELLIAQAMLRYFGSELFVFHDEPGRQLFAEVRCPSVATTTVMAVDDHADTLALLQRYLADTPYHVLAVDDPQQVLELAAAHRPFVLLDVMMPEMDGWSVLMQLRQDERTANLPVLVCSILDQSELALSLGANGFLHKPVTRPALLAALSEIQAALASAH